MINSGEYESIPNAHLLLSSLRSVGYTEEAAIADMIDNCITAKANKIEINFDWENKRIIIFDNGYGMSKEVLLDSMKIGSSDPNILREADDLGRFGMGLKTAAFSLGKRLTVISKEGHFISNACWDLEKIARCNEWKMILFDNDDSFVREFYNFLNTYANGTVVIIDKLDKLIDENNIEKSENKFYQIIKKIKKHISLVFHRFIEEDEIEIKINSNLIYPWNPFIIDNSSTQELSQEIYYHDDKIISIEPYILPHKTKFSSQEEYMLAGGYKGWLNHQGFYIYRNRRLLVYGTWFNILKKELTYNLARIKIDINSNSDFDWQIDIKKSKAVPPVYIEETLEKIASICTEKSSSVYNSRGTYNKTLDKSVPNLSYVWEQRRSNAGKYSFFLNKKHPLLIDLKNGLDEKGKDNLMAYLSLIENFSPIVISGAIDVMKGNMQNDTVDFTESNKDIIHIKRLITLFKSKGYSNGEIVETITAMPSFYYLKNEINKFVEGEEHD